MNNSNSGLGHVFGFVLTLVIALLLLQLHGCGGGQTGTTDGDGSANPPPGTVGASCDPSQPDTCNADLACDVLSATCVWGQLEGDGDEEEETPADCEMGTALTCERDAPETLTLFYCYEQQGQPIPLEQVCSKTRANTSLPAAEWPESLRQYPDWETDFRNNINACCGSTWFKQFLPQEYLWIEGTWVCDPTVEGACTGLSESIFTITVTGWDGEEDGAQIKIAQSDGDFWSELDYHLRASGDNYSLYAPEYNDGSEGAYTRFATGTADIAEEKIQLTITNRRKDNTEFTNEYTFTKQQ